MSKKEISENIEEYLETLYKFGCVSDHVSTTTLSKNLGVAPGSVTQMLKKLEKLGYVNYIPYKGATLTPKGSKIAQKITRKHRILELFLKDILGIKFENLHVQACEMEHSLSDEAERAMCLMLKEPDLCPDGNIIPACDFDFKNCEECRNYSEDVEEIGLRDSNLLSITQVKEGNSGIVSFIRGDALELAAVLELHITMGSKIGIVTKDNSEDYLIITVDDEETPIKRDIANNIFLKVH